MKNKKAVSLMVSYVLLIVIAIGISIGVYSYLKLYLPSQNIECPLDINLVVEDAECLYTQGAANLTLTIVNRGLFNVSAFYARLGEEGRKVRPQINKDEELIQPPIAPGKGRTFFYSDTDLDGTVTGLGNYTVEIQPAVFEKRAFYPCKTISVQKIECTAQSFSTLPTCGNGISEGSEECDDGNLVNGDGCSASCLVEENTPETNCAPSHTISGNNCIAEIALINEDGEIWTDGQTYSRDKSNTDSVLNPFGGILVPNQNAYIEWDISEIPDDATVNSVEFKYHGKTAAPNFAEILDLMNIRPSQTQDTNAGNQNLLSDIGIGSSYYIGPLFIEEGETLTRISAINDLQTKLNNGENWFAIGIMTNRDVSPEIYSSEDATHTPPTLIVTYTP